MLGAAVTWIMGSAWRAAGMALLVAAVAAGAGYQVGHWLGYRAGEAAAKAASNEATIKTVEKQNEVRRLRPDAAGLIDRLRLGKF